MHINKRTMPIHPSTHTPSPADFQWIHLPDFQTRNRTRKPILIFPKTENRFYKTNRFWKLVVSRRFSPLSAPFPLHKLPLRSLLPFHRLLPRSAHLSVFRFSFRSRSAHMLCSLQCTNDEKQDFAFLLRTLPYIFTYFCGRLD